MILVTGTCKLAPFLQRQQSKNIFSEFANRIWLCQRKQKSVVSNPGSIILSHEMKINKELTNFFDELIVLNIPRSSLYKTSQLVIRHLYKMVAEFHKEMPRSPFIQPCFTTFVQHIKSDKYGQLVIDMNSSIQCVYLCTTVMVYMSFSIIIR